MIVPPLFPILPGFLYAETHYRFKYFFSLLLKREPEVIIDAPHRLDPNGPLPIVILAKDADLYPATITSVNATLAQGGRAIRTVPLTTAPIMLASSWWWTVCALDVSDITGSFTCDVSFQLTTKHGSALYHNDNYRTSSHAPLSIRRSGEALPAFSGSLTGELHSHSSYTSDQVEFGLPLGATKSLARSLGLSFLATTDHSYDLDDAVDSYLRNDPGLPQWNAFQGEVEELNADAIPPTIIRGEEVTVRNARGRNVHCLVYGDRAFHPGSGDSAERWLRTRSELDLRTLCDRVPATNPIFGAHIDEPVPFLQRVLLGRGTWEDEDIRFDRLDGVQFWNGHRDEAFESGKKRWVAALLRGKRLTALAGNDAHGNFNRFRQLRIPFVSLWDTDRQLFGRVRTSLWSKDGSESSLLTAIKEGRSILTDGPVCALYDSDGTVLLGKMDRRPGSFRLRARSSSEFGPITRARVMEGRMGEGETIVLDVQTDSIAFESPMITVDPSVLYYRAEVYSGEPANEQKAYACLTNPWWP